MFESYSHLYQSYRFSRRRSQEFSIYRIEIFVGVSGRDINVFRTIAGPINLNPPQLGIGRPVIGLASAVNLKLANLGQPKIIWQRSSSLRNAR